MDINTWPKPNTELKYDKGENRRKHSGNSADALMVREKGNMLVGKCPKGFSQDVALNLLQNGVPECRKTTAEIPYRIWSYYDGAIYVAQSQDGGKSWHGYPSGHPYGPPRVVLKELERRALALGDKARIQNWLDKRWN